MKFSKDILDLAKKQVELKDQIWVLMTNSNDKNKKIDRNQLEKLNKILDFKLSDNEITSVLFWGKYGDKKDFNKIQNKWLEELITNNNNTSNNNNINNKYKNLNEEKEIDINDNLLDIEIDYFDFCLLFDKIQETSMKRLKQKININNIK